MQTLLFDLSQFTTAIESDIEVCCVECSQDLDTDDVIEIDDSIYCNDCVCYCDHCDNATLEDDLETVYTREYSRDPERYCNNCVKKETFTCGDCDNHHSDDLSEYHIEDTDTTICSGCYENNGYFYCGDCDEYYSDRSANYTEDRTYCDSCIGDHIKNENIKDYNYNPLDVLDFLGNPKDDLYLGLELEVYVTKDLSDTANTVSDLLDGYAILKEDSSISMPGFEIVTAPCSLAIHREKITEFFCNNPDIDTDDDHNIGLHVHISRKPISQLSIGKMLVFINNPDNQDNIIELSGRNPSKWAKLSPKKITDVKKKQSSRYEAINLQNNDTIEFRTFTSTIDPKLILARLEFVHCLTVWVKDQSMLELTWNNLTGYIRQNKALYPNLVEWLENNN
jgi:hypothetical protein